MPNQDKVLQVPQEHTQAAAEVKMPKIQELKQEKIKQEF